MKTLMTSKLTRRCLILAVMILGLVYVASSDRYARPVVAAQCCEACPGDGDPVNGALGCLGGGSSLACQGDCIVANNDPNNSAAVAACIACVDACVNDVYDCYSHCVWCGPGGSGGIGSECNSNSDCLYDYFCGADNRCHPY